MKKLYLTIFFISLFLSAYEQAKVDENYTKESEDLKKSIWGWSDKKFQIREIPEKYKNYSKVIIAHHGELVTDTKSSIGFYGISFGKKYHQSLIETIREVIKINDKQAVQEYSELTFTQLSNKSGFFVYDKKSTYVGIRVIKTNGEIREVEADAIVLTNDSKNEKEGKIAIPDLQPGDIIDYFFTTVQETVNDYQQKEYNLVLMNESPVMDYSFHCQLDKSYAVEYRSYNNAPQIKTSKNEDQDILIDLHQQDINPLETKLWVSPKRQIPIIRMNIYLGFNGLGKKPLTVSKAGEVKEITGKYFGFQELFEILAYVNFLKMMKPNNNYDILESTKKTAKDLGIDFKNLPPQEKAALLYYQFRFTNILNFDINNPSKTTNFGSFDTREFRIIFYNLLKMADLDPSILVCDFNDGYRISDALSSLDLCYFIYLPENKKPFLIDMVYDVPFEFPQKSEGANDTKLIKMKDTKISGMNYNNRIKNLTSYKDGKDTLPISSASENIRIEKLTITINNALNSLDIARTTILKGYEKKRVQKNLMTYEDFYEYERNALHITTSLIEDWEKGKNTRKYVDEIKNSFAEAKKNQKEEFLKEMKERFQEDIINVSECKIENPGVRHNAPDFVYSSKFALGGLIKKAGNNLIIDIGKILQNSLVIEESQRKRDMDVYFPYAKGLEYEIEFTIPDGYSVEGLSALNTKIENEAGVFFVEAMIKKQTIYIKIREDYFHNFEPTKKFSKIIEISDEASRWTKTRLLLKKL